MIEVRVSMRSIVGKRNPNEDKVAAERMGEDWVCVLSDGAGGHGGGEIASEVAVRRILEGFRARPARDSSDLRELILDAHDAIISIRKGMRRAAAGMHATLVVLALNTASRSAIWGHVGDSRLYFLRRGRIRSVTRDDSLLNHWYAHGGSAPEAAQLPPNVITKALGITETIDLVGVGEARDHPRKNFLFAALGMTEDVAPQMSEDPGAVEIGDALLLCSDGWWESLANEAIEAALAVSRSQDQWLDRMAATVASQDKPNQDNYSAIGIWIEDSSQGASKELHVGLGS